MDEVKVNDECAIVAHSEPTSTDLERATKRHDKIMFLLQEISDRVYATGLELRAMQDSKDYLLLGFRSFEQYIQEVSFRIKRRTAYNYKHCADCYVDRLAHMKLFQLDKLLAIPYKNTLSISHIILDKEDDGTWKHTDERVLEWFHKAETLNNDDLIKELKDHKLSKDPYKIEPDLLDIYLPGKAISSQPREKNCALLKILCDCSKSSWGNISPESFFQSLHGKNLRIRFEEIK